MSALLKELEEAEARVLSLKQQVRSAHCSDVGHDWKHIGGKNAGCPRGGDCVCSVPVHECAKCGDCDYGDNDEAHDIILQCDLRYDEPSIPTGDA